MPRDNALDKVPLLGAHMSVSGGLHQALYRGQAAGCSVIQIFTQNPNQWLSKSLPRKNIDRFHNVAEETGVLPVASHDSYLVNLASPRKDLRAKSVLALSDEIDRVRALGIPYVVIHPGAHMGDGESAGLRRIADGLNRVLETVHHEGVAILLETTAGQGTHLGHRFEHLAEIIEGVQQSEALGICIDTCHIFAAGYDFRDLGSFRKTLQALDAIVGLDRLKLIHINDSKTPVGSNVDRHEHVGKGFIGKAPFSFFLNDSILRTLPFILETPKGKAGEGAARDRENMETLRQLLERSYR